MIVALLTVFFTSPSFFHWAFERHQNTASWLARPLLVLPYCYFAWRRSLAGIMLSTLAILSSMFWFPAPAVPRQDVMGFLTMERQVLSRGWTIGNVAGALAVISYGWALGAAFWYRSWKLGLGVAAAGALLKSLWSILFSPEAGQTVLPFAFAGLLMLGIAVYVGRWIGRRR
nr:hypothetical protein [Marinicella sp. W31]MDC2879017.1 hypothetical protein [Marinicella sp. W31]